MTGFARAVAPVQLDALLVVSEAAVAELPALIGELAAAQAVALARLLAPPAPPPPPAREEAVRLMTPEELARLVKKDVRWTLRATKGLRFRRNLTRKTIRFEESGARRWAETVGRP